MSARLEELVVADAPATWEALGFTLADGAARIGGVAVRPAGPGEGSGIVGWRLAGVEPGTDLDGLPGPPAGPPPAAAPDGAHPNGAIAVDHVVALTDDFDRTAGALTAAGLELRRVRQVPGGDGARQGFFPLGPALLELAGPVPGRRGAGLWGLTVAVVDLDAAARELGDRLGPIRDAVQPGRRIATVRRDAGSSVALALMTPRAPGGA